MEYIEPYWKTYPEVDDHEQAICKICGWDFTPESEDQEICRDCYEEEMED